MTFNKINLISREWRKTSGLSNDAELTLALSRLRVEGISYNEIDGSLPKPALPNALISRFESSRAIECQTYTGDQMCVKQNAIKCYVPIYSSVRLSSLSKDICAEYVAKGCFAATAWIPWAEFPFKNDAIRLHNVSIEDCQIFTARCTDFYKNFSTYLDLSKVQIQGYNSGLHTDLSESVCTNFTGLVVSFSTIDESNSENPVIKYNVPAVPVEAVLVTQALQSLEVWVGRLSPIAFSCPPNQACPEHLHLWPTHISTLSKDVCSHYIGKAACRTTLINITALDSQDKILLKVFGTSLNTCKALSMECESSYETLLAQYNATDSMDLYTPHSVTEFFCKDDVCYSDANQTYRYRGEQKNNCCYGDVNTAGSDDCYADCVVRA